MRGLSMAAKNLFRTPHTRPALENSTVRSMRVPICCDALGTNCSHCSPSHPSHHCSHLAGRTTHHSPSPAGHWGWEQACFHVYLHEQV